MWFKNKDHLKNPEMVSFRWGVATFQVTSWQDEEIIVLHSLKDVAVEAWLKECDIVLKVEFMAKEEVQRINDMIQMRKGRMRPTYIV